MSENGNIVTLPPLGERAAKRRQKPTNEAEKIAELEKTVENLTSALEKFGEANALLTQATCLLDARIKTLEQKLGSGARMPAIIHPRSG